MPVTHSAIWIAGLKTPPEMWAMIETMIAIARPWASAIATRSCPPVMMIAPAPKKISAKVPMNSATAAFPTLSTYPPLGEAVRPTVAERTLRGNDAQGAW